MAGAPRGESLLSLDNSYSHHGLITDINSIVYPIMGLEACKRTVYHHSLVMIMVGYSGYDTLIPMVTILLPTRLIMEHDENPPTSLSAIEVQLHPLNQKYDSYIDTYEYAYRYIYICLYFSGSQPQPAKAWLCKHPNPVLFISWMFTTGF